MSDEDLKEMLEAVDSYTREACETADTARQSLIDTGFMLPDGELAEPYRALDPRP